MHPNLFEGIAGGLVAFFLCHGWNPSAGARSNDKGEKWRSPTGKRGLQDRGAEVKDKIEQVLTETRVVLTGAQAACATS